MENRLYLWAPPLPATIQSSSWRDRIVGALRHALPQACALCSGAAGVALICEPCNHSLAALGPACPCCALPVSSASMCGKCSGKRPAFDATQAAFTYAFPLDRLIQAYKYNGALSLAGWFAEAMLARRTDPVSRIEADLMIAMPLSRARQSERGFNHALEIARVLSRWSGIALGTRAVTRHRDTPAQATLPWSERESNVRGAFRCTSEVAGRSVIVLDDVMTTGASLDELARTLKRGGARRVENWIVARTLPPRD